MDNNHITYKDHPVYKRLLTSGPKRILSLEGTHGAMTLAYLEEIEEMFTDRFNDPKFVLADYFDLIGSTSPSAFIATLVALGKPIREIKETYLRLGNRHQNELSNHPDLKNLTLGSEKFKTGLAIFAKKVETLGTVVLHNHPNNENYKYNNRLYLIDLLETSSASPIDSKYQEINLTHNKSAIFINNNISEPIDLSEMLFLITTTKSYGFQWRASKDHLLMTSIGGTRSHFSISRPFEFHGYGASLNKLELDEMEKGQNAQIIFKKGNVAAKEEVNSKHFPTSFDFGIIKLKDQPISQEEIKIIFAPILKENGLVYKKCKRVFAKRAESALEITTVTSDGVETKNTAEKGDFIVKNRTSSEEQYVIKKDNFDKRYVAINILPDGVWTEYSPKGEVTGIQLSENLLDKLKLDKHFNLMASWGQTQYCSLGDYIVNPINEDGYYRIGLKEFKETYALKKDK